VGGLEDCTHDRRGLAGGARMGADRQAGTRGFSWRPVAAPLSPSLQSVLSLVQIADIPLTASHLRYFAGGLVVTRAF